MGGMTGIPIMGDAGRLRIGILGPLLVLCDGRQLPVSAGRQRAVLATLALRPGQIVPVDELAEIVWDGRPPAGARVTIRGYVMRLRRALGKPAAQRIMTREPGYVLDIGAAEVDATRFTQLCQAAAVALRAGRWRAARDGLRAASRLWRGEPLVDIPSETLRREAVPGLEQWHLQALEWRIDADLRLGHDRELVPELRALVAHQPLREQFCAQLMLALSRSGRQAEALAVFQRTRRTLVDELGVEPGPELRAAHQHILTGTHYDTTETQPRNHAPRPGFNSRSR